MCFPAIRVYDILTISITFTFSGPKNKRRKQKDRRRGGSRERHRDYYEDTAPAHPAHAGGGSAGRDTRYNDMAPK